MPELTLRDPLNAQEIKEIILQEIGKSLDRDSTLLNDITYPGFTAKYAINLTYERSKVPPTLVWGETGVKTTEEPTEPAGEVNVVGDYTAGPPNVERQSHDLPIPVMVMTPTGQVRKRVKIERQGKKS